MFMISSRRNIVDLWFWWLLCCSFKSLQKPLDCRRAQLEVSVQLFGFFHDVDLELSWILEHVPASGLMLYDKSLAGALSLMQKHKVLTGCSDLVQGHISCYSDSVCVLQELQAEVTAHRTYMNLILEKGRSLAKSSISDADEVLQRWSFCLKLWLGFSSWIYQSHFCQSFFYLNQYKC